MTDETKRLDEIEARLIRLEDMVADWDGWKDDHTVACQGIIDWIHSLELDRLAIRGDGRAQRMLGRIWRSDPTLRPRGSRPGGRGGGG